MRPTPSNLFGLTSLDVMPGLVPGIHVFSRAVSMTWVAGTSPAMTASMAQGKRPSIKRRRLSERDRPQERRAVGKS